MEWRDLELPKTKSASADIETLSDENENAGTKLQGEANDELHNGIKKWLLEKDCLNPKQGCMQEVGALNAKWMHEFIEGWISDAADLMSKSAGAPPDGHWTSENIDAWLSKKIQMNSERAKNFGPSVSGWEQRFGNGV